MHRGHIAPLVSSAIETNSSTLRSPCVFLSAYTRMLVRLCDLLILVCRHTSTWTLVFEISQFLHRARPSTRTGSFCCTRAHDTFTCVSFRMPKQRPRLAVSSLPRHYCSCTRGSSVCTRVCRRCHTLLQMPHTVTNATHCYKCH